MAAEVTAVERMLAETPEDEALDRASLQGRLDKLRGIPVIADPNVPDHPERFGYAVDLSAMRPPLKVGDRVLRSALPDGARFRYPWPISGADFEWEKRGERDLSEYGRTFPSGPLNEGEGDWEVIIVALPDGGREEGSDG